MKKNIENTTGPFVHSVYFWLKNPDNLENTNAFEKAIRKLIRTNPQATSNHFGKAAEVEERAVVDNSFTYFYMMIFSDLETQNLIKLILLMNCLLKKLLIYGNA